MIELYLLRYYLAVVETGNFTRAAEQASVSQPTLSAGIKKLENQLGVMLFERTNRRVFLTEAGSRFLPRARAILHECNMALQEVGGREEPTVLRLGLLSTVSHRQISHLLSRLCKALPQVTVEVMDGTEQELLNRLADRSLDFAISIDRGESGRRVIPLSREAYCFILSKDHALADKSQLKADDLRNEAMIVRSRCEILSETSRYFTDRNIRPRLVYRTPNDLHAVSMAAAGIGGTVVPESLCDDSVATFHLTGFDYHRQLALFRPAYDIPERISRVFAFFEQLTVAFYGNTPIASNESAPGFNMKSSR